MSDLDAGLLAKAILLYAGPTDDPRIGWTGEGQSSPDIFRCERCGAEHLDCSKIDHKDNCTAKAMLEALAHIEQFMAECKKESILNE